MRLALSAAGSSRVKIACNGVEKTTAPIGEGRQEIILHVTLRPGFNRFDLPSAAPAQRLSQARGHLRSFAVHDTAVIFEERVAMAER